MAVWNRPKATQGNQAQQDSVSATHLDALCERALADGADGLVVIGWLLALFVIVGAFLRLGSAAVGTAAVPVDGQGV